MPPLPNKVGAEAPAQQPPAGNAQPGSSFRERKEAELTAERPAAPAPEQPAAELEPQHETPQPGDGSREVVEPNTPDEGLYADDEDDGYEDDQENPDGTPSGDGSGDPEAEAAWEKRYKDLQSEYSRVTQNKGEMEQEHAESMSAHLKLRFELEDRLDEAVTRAGFLRNTMEGNAAQYQNIDWSRVPPDRVAEVQAQAQQAFSMKQQADNAYEKLVAENNEVKNLSKQREAAIAKTRLKRTIPNWGNETYSELRDFAQKSGMPQESFNGITDPVIIEWAYAAKQIQDASSKGVTRNLRNRKAKVPGARNPRRQSRDARGKFASTKVEPNQRGSFANKHQHRLDMENRR